MQFENLLAAHQNNTRRRMAAEKVVVLAQDTTTLSYNGLRQTNGLGPIGDERKPGRGLLLQSLQAFRLDRVPLGFAWAKVWARESVSNPAQRNQQSIDQKESVRWVEAFQAAARIAAQMPGTAVFVSGDRESDLMDLYDRATVAPPNLHLLIRAQHDRVLAGGEKLWDHLSSQPCGASLVVKIPRNKDRLARTATRELRWARSQIKPPRVGCKNSWGTPGLWALMAREINPPKGAEPIDWVLLSDWKIDSARTARRLVRWYGLRWGIECWHQVLKDVCRVETRQLKTDQALSRALVLDMIVAWRVLLLCRLGKTHQHLPASVLYRPEELAILEMSETTRPLIAQLTSVAGGLAPETLAAGAAIVPSQLNRVKSTLTLFQANLLVAMLGGFWARQADGHPGPDLMGRGLLMLNALARWERIKKRNSTKNVPGKQPSRKPE
ncbi:MAG: IS4 family transposase [Verrucomicrobia bacterium]|nr:IS4 family transposase [Verrucomicrobiota bacterium]